MASIIFSDILNDHLSNLTGFSEVNYIGSCCLPTEDNPGAEMRDFILVKLKDPYIAINGTVNTYIPFYKSSGTSDSYAERKNAWFPSNGFFYSLNQVGGQFKTTIMINKITQRIKPYYNILYNELDHSKHIDTNILIRFGDDRWLFISAILGGGFWDSKPELRNKIIGVDIPKFSLHTDMNSSMEEINDSIANNNIYGVNISNVNRLTRLKIKIINHPNINQDILTKLSAIDRRMLIANTYNIEKGLYKKKYNPNIPHSEDIKIMAEKSSEELIDYISELDEILIMLEQSGGNYGYIKNPLTNRKVKINTILGRQIIKKYLDVQKS